MGDELVEIEDLELMDRIRRGITIIGPDGGTYTGESIGLLATHLLRAGCADPIAVIHRNSAHLSTFKQWVMVRT